MKRIIMLNKKSTQPMVSAASSLKKIREGFAVLKIMCYIAQLGITQPNIVILKGLLAWPFNNIFMQGNLLTIIKYTNVHDSIIVSFKHVLYFINLMMKL